MDLYDVIRHRIVAAGLQNTGSFTIPANQSLLIVEIPSGSKLEKSGNKTMLKDVVIAYK